MYSNSNLVAGKQVSDVTEALHPVIVDPFVLLFA